MQAIEGISNDELRSYARRANDDGYVTIDGTKYVRDCDIPALKSLQESYFRLPADADGGQRYRAYRPFELSANGLRESEMQGYLQSPTYNYTEGGKVRTFEPIEPGIRQSDFLRRIIEVDAAFVRETGIVSFGGVVNIGVHQVRYQPVAGLPSFSSPPWLHKDDEPAVFVHLLNLTANLTGGDSVLAAGKGNFQRVLKLLHPFDTLFLTQKIFHAVTPVGIEAGAVGFRDILIVTFQSAVEAKAAA
jgi:hypothetical protein